MFGMISTRREIYSTSGDPVVDINSGDSFEPITGNGPRLKFVVNSLKAVFNGSGLCKESSPPIGAWLCDFE